jgi:hypothetical protein|tara:strand:- start:4173 stop:5225 length:1053 start_codon:yes stop_codon:yes gene_type:complete
MKNYIKSREDFISSYYFARLSNISYSEVLTKEQFENLDIQNCDILSEDNTAVFYKLNKFTLRENDVIFTNYKLINELFFHLRKANEFKNITLITNQQDEMIKKSLYSKKPDCISRWFSINVEHIADDLLVLPLGLSNEYSPKNPNADDFFKLYENMKDSKDISLYINHRANTNLSDRKNIYDIFSDKEWVEIDEPNLEIGSYLNKIQHSLFVLCPWGNGVDTHRVWETLYSGSIPVIKNHQTFTCLKDLPALFINNYEEINLDLLNEFAEKYYSNTFNYEKLKMNYWENLIKNNKKIDSSLERIFQESKFYTIKTKAKLYLIAKIGRYKKIVIFNLNKIKKIPKKLGLIK